MLILVVLELIRGRRLKERYALLWLADRPRAARPLRLARWPQTIAGWMGVATYPPAILFAVATLFVIIVLLYYSTVLSRLADQSTLLAQRVALLEERLDNGGRRRPPPPGDVRRSGKRALSFPARPGERSSIRPVTTTFTS